MRQRQQPLHPAPHRSPRSSPRITAHFLDLKATHKGSRARRDDDCVADRGAGTVCSRATRCFACSCRGWGRSLSARGGRLVITIIVVAVTNVAI